MTKSGSSGTKYAYAVAPTVHRRLSPPSAAAALAAAHATTRQAASTRIDERRL